jgi:hypothetical protein
MAKLATGLAIEWGFTASAAQALIFVLLVFAQTYLLFEGMYPATFKICGGNQFPLYPRMCQLQTYIKKTQTIQISPTTNAAMKNPDNTMFAIRLASGSKSTCTLGGTRFPQLLQTF